MSRDRKRNIQSRKSKRVILVAYEGNNKTEKNYFSNFSGRDKDFIIKPVPGNETDPISLVKQIIQKSKDLALDLLEDDKAYSVFDADVKPEKNAQINKAIKLAQDNNIIPIVSTPCVELWFLLHFKYTTAIVNCNDVINRLKRYYPKYEKNCNIYPELKAKINSAMINSKKLENYQLQNNRRLQTVEANPYTEMYKIVEELIK